MEFDIAAYHSLLSPECPAFLTEYARLPLLRRLEGVGLLCGTDWTPLFHNRFYYSRLDHSVGVALIIWRFTHDRRQTVAGLLHDVATPAFSHVNDFRNGDALTQESTEAPTRRMIAGDAELAALLRRDGIGLGEVDDYHRYPVADNAMPGLSADRLEYMYPSGAALTGIWTLPGIRENYLHIVLLENERGCPELGFDDEQAALEYTRKFCSVSLLLQRHEDKVAMQLLADVLTRAIQRAFISEEQLYTLDERHLIGIFERRAREGTDAEFSRLFATFRGMTAVERAAQPLAGAYCVSLEVKRRYVDPLVRQPHGGALRLSAVNGEAAACISEALHFTDAAYGCVRWQNHVWA